MIEASSSSVMIVGFSFSMTRLSQTMYEKLFGEKLSFDELEPIFVSSSSPY